MEIKVVELTFKGKPVITHIVDELNPRPSTLPDGKVCGAVWGDKVGLIVFGPVQWDHSDILKYGAAEAKLQSRQGRSVGGSMVKIDRASKQPEISGKSFTLDDQPLPEQLMNTATEYLAKRLKECQG